MRYLKNGRDIIHCKICNNGSGLIRKYKLDICRKCILDYRNELKWD